MAAVSGVTFQQVLSFRYATCMLGVCCESWLQLTILCGTLETVLKDRSQVQRSHYNKKKGIYKTFCGVLNDSMKHVYV